MIGSGTQVLLEEITAEFAALPEVRALVLGGAQGGKLSCLSQRD
jgi:hypothetical protein